ncbi:MAG: RES domain-containing protein [Thermostichus sp. DG02_5_bins_236]
MLLWRIVKNRHAAAAFDGEGARRFGGRWNSVGTPMVYCSTTLSLAALEILVHMEVMDLGISRVSIQVDVPTDIPLPQVKLQDLPSHWRSIPAPLELAFLGDQWVQREESLLLAVPSAIIPQENNILLNPRHSNFHRLIFRDPEPFLLDPCLLKSNP